MDCLGIFDQCLHAASSTTVSSACPKCGITTKSGKISCCGRGGSWFGDCGSGGDTKFGHTWYDGLQSCRAWSESKAVIVQQLNEAEQRRDGFINDDNNAKSTTHNFNIYVAPKITAKPSTAVVTTTIYSPANMSTLAPSIMTAVTPNTPSARMTMSHNSENMIQRTPVHTALASQGCKHATYITIHMSLILVVALFER